MQVAELIEQAVTGLGYELVDVESSPRGRLLRVFIDRPESPGAISVDDCATVSNQLTRLFAVENVDYDRLEVSSPGMDRVLKKASDFERFAGQDAALKLRLPVGNQRNFSGTLVGIRDGKVLMRCGDVEHAFELDGIDKARLVPRY